MSREKVLKYSEEKERIEKEMQAISEYLTAPGMPGLKGNLVDKDGFPLPNVDLYQVRQSRQKFNMLNNDYSELMNRIETELHSYFGNKEGQPENVRVQSEPIRLEVPVNEDPVPFAEITEVAEGSPAGIAGLRPRDKIVAFGVVNRFNHEGLTKLAAFVKENEGKPVRVSLIRQNELIALIITPQRWEGTGTLGCRFIPI